LFVSHFFQFCFNNTVNRKYSTTSFTIVLLILINGINKDNLEYNIKTIEFKKTQIEEKEKQKQSKTGQLTFELVGIEQKKMVT